MANEEQQTGGDEQWGPWRARIAASRKRRDELIPEWQDNVDRRRVSTGTTSDHTTRVPKDWALTKAKIAGLYSRTPEVRLSPRQGQEQFAAAVAPFGREINDTVEAIGVGGTIEEILADVSNASGIGGVLASCDKRSEERLLPKDDRVAAAMSGRPPEMVLGTKVVDIKYMCLRISPADLLIPSDFTGSNYDDARWLGHEDRMTWTQAMASLGLTEDQKEEALGRDKRAGGTTHTLNTENDKFKDTDVVNFTEIFYWRHYYHPEETNFRALHRLVFVDGVEEPVINEPYQVQRRLEDGRLVGVTKNPIRVLTLTYISDHSLPPSDSSVGKFQVDELEESRDGMVQQRKHSIPIRWGNTNLISQATKSKIDQGTHQGFIWINGRGESAIGEVARATFPSENFEFDKVIGNDLSEIWQVGTNQAGAYATGERSAKEAGIIEQNFQRRVGQEQDKVQKFFLGIVEVLAGHLALYGTFDLPDELGPMRQQMANAFTYSVRVDSTVRLNAEQRIEQLTRALNLTAQSGYVNPKAVIAEIWELSGVDPAKVVIDPQPKAPEPVKVSIGNAEDIINPVMLGALMRTGQAPGPDDIAAAIKLLQQAALGGVPLVPPQPASDGPQGDVEHPKGVNQDWETSPRIERRADDGGA
jgi:hypothetical protein